ncbi:3-oxoadipate enol-lactonase [Syntrophus gentianae]|uniref:3-oxoadipate enol-lactonase n=1 Tax=Syntrophus gentianae TaxID=43775 RepID=A0A1H8AI27_9BACT|nr:alpha/beta fold hydrolase [Syntrophus gentianae]SEM69459.1 3-oxoadipate enol-lactonase [Syntrophus gentianae]
MPLADVNGTVLSYSLEGPENGAVVMFSNSLASDRGIWKFQAPVLTGAGYRVLRYDSRGHGQSVSPAGPYSMEMLSLDALGLMDFLGLDKVHFCGISLGGMIAQMMGAFHGEHLLSLILCDTTSYTASPEIWDERIETIRKLGTAAVVDATIDRWFTKAGQARLPDEVNEVRRMILNMSVEGYCGCCSAIRTLNLRQAIGNISARTLVIVGEQDVGTPVSEAEYIHGRIAFSKLRIIPDAAHLVNVEQAGRFNATILEFLKALEPL